MRFTRREFLLTSAAMPLAARLAHAATGKDALVVAYPFDVPSWDPVAYTAPLGMPIFASVFDQPLAYSPDLKLEPNVVDRWQWQGKDGLAIALEFRRDVTFHNGDKLTAADFRFSFLERQKADPKLATAAVWRNIQDIEILSSTEAVVRQDFDRLHLAPDKGGIEPAAAGRRRRLRALVEGEAEILGRDLAAVVEGRIVAQLDLELQRGRVAIAPSLGQARDRRQVRRLGQR